MSLQDIINASFIGRWKREDEEKNLDLERTRQEIEKARLAQTPIEQILKVPAKDYYSPELLSKFREVTPAPLTEEEKQLIPVYESILENTNISDTGKESILQKMNELKNRNVSVEQNPELFEMLQKSEENKSLTDKRQRVMDELDVLKNRQILSDEFVRPEAQQEALQRQLQREDILKRIPEEFLGMTPDQLKEIAPFLKATAPIKEKTPLALQSAILSGYAGEELVKLAFPDAPNPQDVSIGELQQRLGLMRAENQANAPKQVPSEQIDKITNMFNAIGGLKDIRDQFFGLSKKGKNPVDPIMGRWSDLKLTLGFMSDSDVSRFQTDSIAQMNTYLNAISGAAITEQEAVRLKKRLPAIGSTKEQFLGQMDSFNSELNRSLSNRIKVLKSANYKIGELEKYIIKEPKSLDDYMNSKEVSFKSKVLIKKLRASGVTDDLIIEKMERYR